VYVDDATYARRASPSNDAGLARARVRFLTSEPVAGGEVRDDILTSWRRSQQFEVAADKIEHPYIPDTDPDTPLIRAAEPVLRRLGEQLDGQPISVILTDRNGVVLTQHTGDLDLHRHLENVELVPGFSYGEQFVGTNGIGTALQDGKAAHVFGHEHYAEHLENLACVGVPIQHPISGRMIGAVDLTCWRKDAGQLLIALAKTTAEQIGQALVNTSQFGEVELLHSYMKACRRTTGIVIAFNDTIMMMNDLARRLLDLADQSVLLGHATEALADGRARSVTVSLPTGSRARMHCRPVPALGRHAVAGTVVTVKLIETDEPGCHPALPMFLPGVVGSTPPWLRCCHEVDAAAGEWLVLAGEHGVGKHTLARCVHQRRNPTGRMRTLDADSCTAAALHRELLDDPADTLVIRHVDSLDRQAMAALIALLTKVRSRPVEAAPWVVVTVTGEASAELLAFFPRTVQVPPLRRHVEDLSELVPLFLSKLYPAGQMTCSPAALHLLMRWSWPGNVTQLYQVLKRIGRHRRTGTIRPADLPAEFHTVTRRALNELESLERDAIVHSLADAEGNKVTASRLLGISRATLYRKIHEYGIVTPDR
jgi:sigma-54 dependent transcriptional regulator, acetoin dehydrogenase operon transcriptional activator AcoR